jgi:hypothetical protein
MRLQPFQGVALRQTSAYIAASQNRPAGHAVAVSFAFRALVGLKTTT